LRVRSRGGNAHEVLIDGETLKHRTRVGKVGPDEQSRDSASHRVSIGLGGTKQIAESTKVDVLQANSTRLPLESCEGLRTVLFGACDTRNHSVVHDSVRRVRYIVDPYHKKEPAILNIKFVLETELNVGVVFVHGVIEEG
jgi:hypothetical protein